MNMYDPYNPYGPYPPYGPQFEEQPPRRAVAWVFLILALIVALVDVYFWLPVYNACVAYGHDVMAVIDDYTKAFALFAGIAVVFLVLSIIANVKFSRCGKFYGRSFGGFLGKFIIFLSYATYAVAIIAFFLL